MSNNHLLAYPISGACDADECVLVSRYTHLAKSIAKRMTSSRRELEDIEQVAMLGLVKAVRRYDSAKGAAFSTFAWTTIEGEVKRHFRDHSRSIHVCRTVQERAAEVVRFVDEFSQSNGRTPTTNEIGAALTLRPKQVVEATEADRARRCESMTKADGSATDVVQYDQQLENCDDSLVVDQLLTTLSQRERTVFEMRYFSELTQVEIAREIGVSQMHISRILSRGITKLRLSADDLELVAAAS